MATTPRKNTRRPSTPPARSTDLDAVAAETTLEPFVVTWQGRDWEFTHMELLDTWALTEDVGQLTKNDQILMLFELALGEQWEEFHAHPLPVGILQRLFEDYNAYCGISLGK